MKASITPQSLLPTTFGALSPSSECERSKVSKCHPSPIRFWTATGSSWSSDGFNPSRDGKCCHPHRFLPPAAIIQSQSKSRSISSKAQPFITLWTVAHRPHPIPFMTNRSGSAGPPSCVLEHLNRRLPKAFPSNRRSLLAIKAERPQATGVTKRTFISADQNKTHSRYCRVSRRHEVHPQCLISDGETAHFSPETLRTRRLDPACKNMRPNGPTCGAYGLAAAG